MCCSRGVRLALQECDLEAYIQVSDLERYQSDPQRKTIKHIQAHDNSSPICVDELLPLGIYCELRRLGPCRRRVAGVYRT
jgi:hypothetical protein